MTDELKPVRCGCGGEAVLETDHDTIQPVAPIDWKRVRCNKCNIRTTWRKSEAEAIEAWNRAMGAKDINVPNKERTAKVEISDGWFRCCGCDYCTERYSYDWKYCPMCGCRLIWGDER